MDAIGRFFILSAPSVEISGGPSCGTRYSLSTACQFCGSGAFPVGDRIVEEIPKDAGRMFFTDDHELIVDEALATVLRDSGIQSLARIVDLQAKVLPFYELRSEATLPRFSALTTGFEIEDQCSHCKRDGFFHIPRVAFKPVYKDIDPAILNYNVLETYELFGTSCLKEPFSDSKLASPKFLVSDKLVAVLLSESVEPTSFEPAKLL